MNAPPLTLSQTQVCEYTGYSVATVRMLERTTFMVDGRETRRPGAWTLHDLRHVAAGIIHELTQSPEAVRIILGHASTDMTLGYIAEASAKTGETLKLLDEAMRPKR